MIGGEGSIGERGRGVDVTGLGTDTDLQWFES